MNEHTIPAEWFARFMTHAVNNINNRDGNIRFSYKQLRRSLDSITRGREDDADPEVKKLLQNIVTVLPEQELSDRQVRTLCLAMMNAHMAYHIVNPELVRYIDG